jgi:formylglycine-generating enzyme required for sulfatase activity
MHYCEWISRKTGKFYRLPTEAEWEYACRGGAETRYFFGNDAKDLGDYAWFAGNSKEKTQDAGQKKPNPFGLYDMLGNVMEYCLGSYTKDYSDFKPVGELPKRNEKGVLRGGSFLDPPDRLRCASRQPVLAKWNERNPQRPVGAWWFTDGYMCGLRVVRPVKQEERPTLPKDPKE